MSKKFKVVTDHPVAVDSNDHLFPHGTMRDDSRSPEFNKALEMIIDTHGRGDSPSILDIGCAGGGMVQDFVEMGWDAIGIEGSDYSQKIGRASWGIIPDHLFTADATKPFYVSAEDEDEHLQKMIRFDVITAWEVLEHIKDIHLSRFFANVSNNISPSGLFICSVANYAYTEDGVVYHQTVKPMEWWEEKIPTQGFIRCPDLEDLFNPSSWVRHSHNKPNEYGDWSKCYIFRKAV